MSEHRIGRIFAYWAFFSLGIFLKMTGVAQFFEPLFISTEKVLHSCWQKNCFGYIFGHFFTNPSGHPAHKFVSKKLISLSLKNVLYRVCNAVTYLKIIKSFLFGGKQHFTIFSGSRSLSFSMQTQAVHIT
jgi:hypothetical protein